MTRVLLAMIGLLVLILAYQWQRGDESVAVDAVPVDKPVDTAESGADVSSVLDSPPLSSFDEVVLRPLFIEGRRPPPELEDEPEEVTPVPPPRLTRRPVLNLTAVLIINGERYAVLRGMGKKQDALKLKVGEDYEGWKVANIEPKQVTLKLGGNEEIYQLREYGKVPLPVPVIPVKPSDQPVEQKGRAMSAETKETAPVGNK